MQKAAIYLRISDDREGRRYGVDRQRADCEALARRENLTVVNVFTDNDIGASKLSRKPRPQYRRMLAAAEAGAFDIVLAGTTSRLTRRQRENEDLIDLALDTGHRVAYRFAKSTNYHLATAAGRRDFRRAGVDDAAESDTISERVRDAARQRAEQARPHGGPRRYGITAHGTELVDHEAAELRRWFAQVLAGGSLGGIRRDLERRQVPTTTGEGRWRTTQIRRLLLHPVSAGLREYPPRSGVMLPAPTPAIVDEATWRAVAGILTDSDRRTHSNGTARKWTGTGLYVCERCRRTVVVGYHKNGSRLYRCACHRSWGAERIDVFVSAAVEAVLDKEDARLPLLPRSRDGVDVEALRTERATVRTNMVQAAKDQVLARGVVKVALSEALDEGQRRIDEIDAEIAKAAEVDPLAGLVAADDPVAAWLAVDDLARQQAVIRRLMTVTLGAPPRGRATHRDPSEYVRLTPAV